MESHGIGCWGIVTKDQKVLLIKNKKRGYWEAPGGRVETGELIEDALKREILEESGLTVRVGKNIEIYQYFEEGKQTHWVCHGHLCEYDSGEIVNGEPDKLEDVKWFPVNDLPNGLNQNTKKAIEKYGF